MRRVAFALLAAAFLAAGCAHSGANAPPPQRHVKPSSNQNPDTEAH